MPCFSSITKTRMTNGERMVEALRYNGWIIEEFSGDRVIASQVGSRAVFSRGRDAWELQGSALRTEVLDTITRTYSEIGVRQWGQRRGFLVGGRQEADNRIRITFNDRRA